ncbi:hemA [Symbiodinium sp. CCMP2592]|nr:hemA [Symbiodinium sp. CCMP2592]
MFNQWSANPWLLPPPPLPNPVPPPLPMPVPPATMPMQFTEAFRADLLRQLREQHELEQDRKRESAQKVAAAHPPEEDLADLLRDEKGDGGAPSGVGEASNPKPAASKVQNKVLAPKPKYIPAAKVKPEAPASSQASEAVDQELPARPKVEKTRPKRVGTLSVLGGTLEIYARFTPSVPAPEVTLEPVPAAVTSESTPARHPLPQEPVKVNDSEVLEKCEEVADSNKDGNVPEQPEASQSSAPQTPPRKLFDCIASQLGASWHVSKRAIEKMQYGCKRARGGAQHRQDRNLDWQDGDYYDQQEAEQDLKDMAAAKPRKPATSPQAEEPRAEKETSGLKPRRLFQEGSKAGSKRSLDLDELEDDDPQDDNDLFGGNFEQDRKALQLSSRKKVPRKKAPAEPEPESSHEAASPKQEDNKPDEEEAVQEPSEPELSSDAEATEASVPRPSRDSKAQDVRSKFEPELLKLLLDGMSSTDADHCLDLLLCEDITSLSDATELLLDLPAGELLESLGEKARLCAKKLTLTARRAVLQWPKKLKDSLVALLVFVLDLGELPAYEEHAEKADLRSWLQKKLEEHRLSTDADIRKSKELFLQKIAFVDRKSLQNLPVAAEKQIVMSDWEALLDDCRQAAASAGLPLRPRLHATAVAPEEPQQIVALDDADLEPPAADSTERMEYTPTKTLFLQTQAGTAGVFEVLKARKGT